MHRVVPELIVENYRAGRYRGEFPAVGMFLDLSGFSTMTDALMQHGQHGAEVLASLMRGVFDPLVKTILAYGGKIVSFMGDGILVFFPITDDAGDAALRALASAWIVQQNLLERSMQQTVYGRFVFSIKIGLSLGPVSWGILRSENGGQATYYFRGPVVDDSTAAEKEASAGEILLSGKLHDVFGELVRTRPSGTFYRFDAFHVDLPRPVPLQLPPVDLEVSKVFMPEDVILRDARGEFRQIVNLFMRFPDLPDERLRTFMRLAFELKKRYGGLITRLDFGDKGCNLLMLWGAPVAYENDIVRALNFILDLQEDVDFPVTAGVTYYIAHAGYLGSELCEDYTCYGWGVNLASRFMMTAPEGDVWVDERIVRRLSRRFDFDYVGSHDFKGFATEQKVHVLRGRGGGTDHMYRGEMVGREQELLRLKEFVEPLWRGGFTGVLAVTGDAGIGKSRLIREFMLFDEFGGGRVLRAICPTDQILKQSFNPLRRWLSRYFGIPSRQSVDERKRTFNAKLDDLIASLPDPEPARELDRVRSILGGLLGLDWEGSLFSQLDAEGRYNNTILALIALIKAESMIQPLLLFFEDVQFIDPDTRVFLARLKRALESDGGGHPVAILFSSRPAGIQPFLDEHLIDHFLELEALSATALASLAENHLGGIPSPELVQFLESRSEGNPYFAEQILAYLQEESLLELGRAGWGVTRSIQESSLPADILVLLVARLDQLPADVKDVILTASVMGREFDVQALAGMLKKEGQLDREILEAEQADIWVAAGPFRYVFTHGLLRDAAYAMQVRARRMELHASAVATLEELYADELKNHYEELAYHAENAGSEQKALFYLWNAGKTAADLYQNNQAVDYLTRALAYAPFDDLKTRFDIFVERVEIFARMGKRDLQLKDLNSLEKLASHMNDADCIAQVVMLRSAYHFFDGNYHEAIECAKRVEDCSDDLANSELALYTHVVWATALLHLGHLDQAMEHGQKTLEHAQRVGNKKEQCRILNALGWIALEQNKPEDARRCLDEGLKIAHEIKEPGMESRVLNQIAKLEGEVNGNYALAREYYEKVHQIDRKIGDRFMESVAMANLGFAAGMQGDFEAARSYYEQSLILAREIGNPQHEIPTLVNLSAVAGAQRKADDALRYAQKAVELSRKFADRVMEGWGIHYLGHAYLLLDQIGLAQQAYRRSIEIRNELGQISLSMEPLAGLVESYLRVNDIESAEVEAEKILKFLESGEPLNGTDEPLRVYYTCYRFLERKNDPRSRLILQAAADLLKRQVSNFKSEAERRRYIENIPWRRALHEAAQTKLS